MCNRLQGFVIDYEEKESVAVVRGRVVIDYSVCVIDYECRKEFWQILLLIDYKGVVIDYEGIVCVPGCPVACVIDYRLW